MSNARLGAIEAGGTHIVVAITDSDPTQILESEEFATTTPDETLSRAHDWLRSKNITALGIASFGPIDIDQKSPTYGYITSTPKPHWHNTNFVGRFRDLGVPTFFQTDVNAAALAEMQYGQHGDIHSCVYITVGTGVGVGVVNGKQPLCGITHPEGGHIRVPRFPGDDYQGNCPYHKDCLEGLANARALADRAGIPPSELRNLPDDHPVWNMQAFYLAQLCSSLILLLSPEVIVIGGGVLKRGHILFPAIHRHTLDILNGYVAVPRVTEGIATLIVPSKFFPNTGVVGALELARLASS
eukprot:TRINITY_DN197_c0_g1_i5.p1 TRINITY_DN197_c0_g1~~TRINITY_DN197_c0_g1_i5.p1  ORF type:complete len:298 (-),score=82.42 TRINITY_DN197_c0_g1_i5:219-1112(-)